MISSQVATAVNHSQPAMASPRSMDFNDFVGLPWLDRGRDRSGADCWGLCRIVLHDIAGITLPSYADAYDDTSDPTIGSLIDDNRRPWSVVPLGREKPLDLILIRQAPWHVGIVVRRGMMLHMPEDKTSIIEPYTTGRYGRRVEGIYRHSALSGLA